MKTAFPDARTLIVVVLAITTMAIAINDPIWLAPLLILTISALASARISLYRLINRLHRYRWLFFLLALVQSVTNSSGTIWLEFQGYTLLSSGGLLSAAAVILRVIIILAAALLLSLRDSQQLVTGLVQMKVPYELAYMVLLGIRFIPVLSEEFQDALTAMQLRGIELDKIPLRQRIGVYNYILMPTVAGALIRARRISTAMEARAFRAKPRRTWLDWPRLSKLDWFTSAAVITGLILSLWLYRGGI